MHKTNDKMKRTHIFKVKENEYEVIVPTMGQFVEIEDRKARFANNNYNGMVNNKTFVSERALDMVDMAAYLYTLVPELIKDMKVTNIFDMDVMDANDLLKTFKTELLPWIKSVEETLLRPTPAKKVDPSENTSDDTGSPE